MDNYTIVLIGFFIGLCIGILVMSVLADRNNKAEADRLRQQIAQDSRNYLSAVSTMESEINAKEDEIRLKQRVLDSLNEEVQRLRRIIEKNKQKGGQLCG